ncbi:hypothetical protein [Tissierella sp. Yu-01]|uniref:hypothetical protein n=1 Tax=Tissierella sp. Yu-01 TaxID=3035694 RepID=UPI00240E15B2|nr:hypothetical protein [Tissierella sp. Yu-01]WFA07914.1 hypothetical protein P3962_09225 [Tissierella sp. Yu-01]
MKVYIDNQILEFNNDKSGIEKILNEIEKEVTKTSKVLNSLIIDDYEIFSDYYDYFLDNIRVIEKVEVVLLTYKELVNETLSSTLDYLKRTPELIENLANSFYKSSCHKSWSDLDALLEGITWLVESFSTIDSNRNLNDVISDYKSWNLYSRDIISLSEILPDFEDALSNRDNIIIADILSYEIQPKFNTMVDNLSKLVNMEEGMLNDLN